MILVVAPYGSTNQSSAHLGASRKIEMIIQVLAKIDSEVVLVNSAHQLSIKNKMSCQYTKICGVEVLEIIPALQKNKQLGKLFNLFQAEQIVLESLKHGVPKLCWIYNGYAFEMQYVRKLRQYLQIPVILEFEDWHFSRKRGINPKPYIDYIFWMLAAPLISATFAVNDMLAKKMRRFGRETYLLPGVVPLAIINNWDRNLPFSSSSKPVKIGFFGGLSKEKGADIVLELAKLLSLKNYIFNVTGSGVLESEFVAYAKSCSDSFFFHGKVSDDRLYELILDCDILLNPHVPIAEMDNGVFPFKVIEAVASGRLLISTKVPMEGVEDVLAGTYFSDYSSKAFHESVLNARNQYEQSRDVINRCAMLAHELFGQNKLFNVIENISKETLHNP